MAQEGKIIGWMTREHDNRVDEGQEDNRLDIEEKHGNRVDGGAEKNNGMEGERGRTWGRAGNTPKSVWCKKRRTQGITIINTCT